MGYLAYALFSITFVLSVWTLGTRRTIDFGPFPSEFENMKSELENRVRESHVSTMGMLILIGFMAFSKLWYAILPAVLFGWLIGGSWGSYRIKRMGVNVIGPSEYPISALPGMRSKIDHSAGIEMTCVSVLPLPGWLDGLIIALGLFMGAAMGLALS